MSLFLFNLAWMSVNIVLAFIGVLFGYLFLKVKKRALKLFFLLFWLLFLPNTIYLLTDIQYFPGHWIQANNIFKFIFLFQYVLLMILGIVTFTMAIKPMKLILKLRFIKNKFFQFLLIILVNFIISFGVILGKFQRVHSWYVITDPKKVIAGSLNVLTSYKLLIYVLLFGIVVNFVYFFFNKSHFKYTRRK